VVVPSHRRVLPPTSTWVLYWNEAPEESRSRGPALSTPRVSGTVAPLRKNPIRLPEPAAAMAAPPVSWVMVLSR